MIEWIIIVGLVIAMYIMLYKYEKKISNLEEKLDDHHHKLNDHHERIKKNDNHIQQMWVTFPKHKKSK